jgi:xanthine dehydrogenase small subunit
LESPSEDQFDRQNAETTEKLKSIPANSISIETDGATCHLPTSVDELATLLEKTPSLRMLAGGTDLGLEVTQALRAPTSVVYLGNVNELTSVSETNDGWDIGSAVTFSDLMPLFKTHYPELAAMVERLGSEQIRNQGTIGGNIGNASPIGDTPPVLIALGAELILRKGKQQRTLPVEDYFKDYKVTALQSGEFIQTIRLPKPPADKSLKVYKVSKRIDDDISAVLAAFHIKVENEQVVEFSAAFGGMAAIPKRARHCETALLSQPWNLASINHAMQALAKDFSPLTDVRATKEYRLTVAQNLLKKCFLELTQAAQHSRVTFYDAAKPQESSHA